MKIGHSNQSMTFVPDVESDDIFTYADCPGFLDNRGPEINIANAVNIKTMIHRAASVRVFDVRDVLRPVVPGARPHAGAAVQPDSSHRPHAGAAVQPGASHRARAGAAA